MNFIFFLNIFIMNNFGIIFFLHFLLIHFFRYINFFALWLNSLNNFHKEVHFTIYITAVIKYINISISFDSFFAKNKHLN